MARFTKVPTRQAVCCPRGRSAPQYGKSPPPVMGKGAGLHEPRPRPQARATRNSCARGPTPPRSQRAHPTPRRHKVERRPVAIASSAAELNLPEAVTATSSAGGELIISVCLLVTGSGYVHVTIASPGGGSLAGHTPAPTAQPQADILAAAPACAEPAQGAAASSTSFTAAHATGSGSSARAAASHLNGAASPCATASGLPTASATSQGAACNLGLSLGLDSGSEAFSEPKSSPDRKLASLLCAARKYAARIRPGGKQPVPVPSEGSMAAGFAGFGPASEAAGSGGPAQPRASTNGWRAVRRACASCFRPGQGAVLDAGEVVEAAMVAAAVEAVDAGSADTVVAVVLGAAPKAAMGSKSWVGRRLAKAFGKDTALAAA